MTKTEIIKETYEYYKADPLNRRGTSIPGGVTCLYKNLRTGAMCAVGRCLALEGVIDDQVEVYNQKFGSVESMGDSLWSELSDKLKPEYQGHERYFWQQLQDFHDSPNLWSETGISVNGELFYQELLKEFENQ